MRTDMQAWKQDRMLSRLRDVLIRSDKYWGKAFLPPRQPRAKATQACLSQTAAGLRARRLVGAQSKHTLSVLAALSNEVVVKEVSSSLVVKLGM